MKLPVILILLGLVLSVLNACNNDRGRGLNDYGMSSYTHTPDCLLAPNGSGGLCSFQYSQYQYQGFFNYQYNQGGLSNNYAEGFCGCGNNSFPVYQNKWGLGCVDSQTIYGFNNSNVVPLMFQWNARSFQFTPVQTLNLNGYTCPDTVFISCDTSVQGACGPSATCRTSSNWNSSYNNSRVGVCVLNNTNSYRQSF